MYRKNNNEIIVEITSAVPVSVNMVISIFTP